MSRVRCFTPMRFSLLSSYRPVRRPNTGGPTRTTSSTRAIRAAASDERRRYAGTSPSVAEPPTSPRPSSGPSATRFAYSSARVTARKHFMRCIRRRAPRSGSSLLRRATDSSVHPRRSTRASSRPPWDKPPRSTRSTRRPGRHLAHAFPGHGQSRFGGRGGGRVLVNHRMRTNCVRRRRDRRAQWTAPTSPGATSQESSPAVFLGTVYVGSDNGLYAFNLSTGAPLWPRYPLGGTPGFRLPVIASPNAPPLVLIGDSSQTITAVNAITGALAHGRTRPASRSRT